MSDLLYGFVMNVWNKDKNKFFKLSPSLRWNFTKRYIQEV